MPRRQKTYIESEIINLLKLVSEGKLKNLHVDSANSMNFVKVANAAKTEFLIKRANNGSVQISLKDNK